MVLLTKKNPRMSTCYTEEISNARHLYHIIIVTCCVTIILASSFTVLLIKNLFCVKWNHLSHKTPSLRIKILAVSMPLIFLTFSINTLIYSIIFRCDSGWIRIDYEIFCDKRYGFDNNQHKIMEHIFILFEFVLMISNWALYPSFILEIIHNLFSKNKRMHQILENPCCKHFYCYMLVLIIMEPILFIFALILMTFGPCPGISAAMNVDDVYFCISTVYLVY